MNLRKISAGFLTPYIFFLVCMLLDFYATITGSNGDWTTEGNAIARLWWQIMGPFRFIEIPIWAAFVFFTGYITYKRSRLLASLWLYILGFNHLLGFSTWLPYSEFIYFVNEYIAIYNIGPLSFILGLIATLIQLSIMKFF